ncbi:hypothetical protein DAMDJJ_14770 [Cupriavidus necator]|uniref:class I SAM-dependent methyltransferase n=1 Tax=Cupriavidus necator TaxID=106590 RepID=UPI003F731EED
MSECGHVPFDQYQRYAVVAHIVGSFMRNVSAPVRVLEVGANSHKLLKRFLPEAEILFLDREVPEALREDSDVVIGDATALEYPDASFDFVVALDVFEHIPSDKRPAFLRETGRVAACMAILAAPFDTPGTAEAEEEADALWREFFGSSYRWLEEHKVCGLPSAEDTAAWLNAEGLAYARAEHGSLSLWRDMLSVHFAKEYVPEMAPIVARMDDYYNRNLFSRDFRSPAYRSFFLYGRTRQPINEAMEALRALSSSVGTSKDDGLYESLLTSLPAVTRRLCQERKALAECRSMLEVMRGRIQASDDMAEAVQAELAQLREQLNSTKNEVEHWRGAHAAVSEDLGRLRHSWPIRMLERLLLRKTVTT